jgi:hypothetical protein
MIDGQPMTWAAEFETSSGIHSCWTSAQGVLGAIKHVPIQAAGAVTSFVLQSDGIRTHAHDRRDYHLQPWGSQPGEAYDWNQFRHVTTACADDDDVSFVALRPLSDERMAS